VTNTSRYHPAQDATDATLTYERIKALLEQDDSLSDTYPAQAGWADSAMNDYDRYDEHRK